MKSFHLTEKSIPVLFAVTAMLAYGLLAAQTGFYWDDWPFAWIATFINPREFIPAFAPFRPFLGPIFFLTTSVIPADPLYWQVFAILIRVIIGAASFWTFNLIWSRQKFSTLTISLLLIVFPGYSQHWAALTHINQELIPFIFYILSFGFTFKALSAERPFKYIIIALLFQACGIFPTEYFFTAEPLRFLFLFSFFQGGFIERFRKSFKQWIPYLAVWIFNAAWLFYYYKFGAYNSYGITVADTQSESAPSLFAFVDALYKVGFYIWIQIVVLASKAITAPSTLAMIALVVVSFSLLIFYFFHLPSHNETQITNNRVYFIAIGIIGILLGRIPSWVAGLPLDLQSINDRFMVSMMIGGSLFVVGLLSLIKQDRARIVASALLIALGVGQQFFNANLFRRDWEKQREIYWQMAWRIPDLQKGTLILTHELPLEYETDFSATAALNWIYAPDFTPPNLSYALMYTRSRLGGPKLPDLNPNTESYFPYRTVVFRAPLSASVTIYAPPSGCVRVLDPIYANAQVYERYPKFLTRSIPFSDPTRIIADAPERKLPENIFGKEPPHEWCYYYEKAELARQKDDWKEAASLGNQALNQGYVPEDAYEWLPFIEAYALTGDLQKAEMLSRKAFNAEVKPGTGICQIWQRAQAKSDISAFAKDMLSEFHCTQ